MLKALKNWRDRATAPTKASPGSADPRERAEAAAVVADDGLPLLEVGPSKEAFLGAVCRDLSACRPADELLADVEGYFRRHAGPDLMTRWGWESIEAAAGAEVGESLQAVIARSMVEAGVRMVTLVLEGHVAMNRDRPLLERLWQAEWSVRRADQTLFLEEDEVLAARRPADGFYLEPAAREAV